MATGRFLDRDVLDAAKAHARADYPNECCGAVTPDGYVPLRNAATVKLVEFDCDAELEPLREAGTLLALVHSHPLLLGREDPALGPSEYDIAQQMAMDIPWGITLVNDASALDPYYWGDMIDPPPLEGRMFRHGPSGTDGRGDCGALIKDWYRINRGIVIKEMPRAMGWWDNGQSLYDDHFAERGFVQVSRATPEVGDLVLMRVIAKVTNHAAVYLGDGMILHHLSNRLSRRDPIVNWMPLVTQWLRYAG